jgi:hypothetical protein
VKCTCKAFTRAKIIEIDENEENEEEILIRFETGTPKPRTLTVNLLGELTDLKYHYECGKIEKLGPAKMYTSAWEWRMTMKIGDSIDCCDEYHNWFTALVLDIRECTGTNKGVDIDGAACREA